MGGWKMVAARRAAAPIADPLTRADRFAVLTFDTQVEHPAGLGQGLAQASDRHRFTAVERLAAATPGAGPNCSRRCTLDSACWPTRADPRSVTGCWCWSPTAR